jgi:hypothetical protein
MRRTRWFNECMGEALVYGGGGGDFNVIRHAGEKLRASRQTQAMTDFADFISE